MTRNAIIEVFTQDPKGSTRRKRQPKYWTIKNKKFSEFKWIKFEKNFRQK